MLFLIQFLITILSFIMMIVTATYIDEFSRFENIIGSNIYYYLIALYVIIWIVSSIFIIVGINTNVLNKKRLTYNNVPNFS